MEIKDIYQKYFNELINKSIFVIRETRAQYKNPAVMWSTGKDSTTVLNLIKESFFGKIPWKVIHLDTHKKFPEIYRFRDTIAREWNLNLVVASDKEAEKVSPETTSRFECCTKLKTNVLKQVIKEHKFDALIVSIRRDEHGIRSYERYMSPRDRDFRWKISKPTTRPDSDSGLEALQDAELSGWRIFASDFGPECSHVRVHPILHWREIDIWNYIKERRIPINPLYFSDYVGQHYPRFKGKRFRSLGCMPCTFPVKSNASSLDDIISELGTTKTEERAGRAQDKEKEYLMQQLRALGYM